VREAFKTIARWLRDCGIKPKDVEVVLRFKNRRDRDKAAFSIGKDFEGIKRIPGIPDHIYAGAIHGITFKLKQTGVDND